MPMVMMNLRSEAAAEAGRIARVRTLLRDDDAVQLGLLEGSGVWIARIRRTETRQALGGRFVLVWRIALEDAGGRLVESGLVPVAVDLSREGRRGLTRSRLNALVAQLERETLPLVTLYGDEWQQTADRAVRCFTSARLERERAIARWLSPSSTTGRAYQPGLFDRRVERERRLHASSASETEQAVAERLLSVEQLTAVRPRLPQLLLVVVP
jgi:hypothetical protein